MRITEDELNLAYLKVNELKNSGYLTAKTVDIDIERNPLTDVEFFNPDSEFITPVKLTFEFDKTLGSRGSYVLATEVEIIEETED